MIQDGKGDVTITNDGATILKQSQVLRPAARMLSKAPDVEAGDGTTSGVIIAAELAEECNLNGLANCSRLQAVPALEKQLQMLSAALTNR
uniref:Uncharacterized protein n=1 Tax=Suricata suricatta TaxID=37032 RepID=A0A673TIV3_SURSU